MKNMYEDLKNEKNKKFKLKRIIPGALALVMAGTFSYCGYSKLTGEPKAKNPKRPEKGYSFEDKDLKREDYWKIKIETPEPSESLEVDVTFEPSETEAIETLFPEVTATVSPEATATKRPGSHTYKPSGSNNNQNSNGNTNNDTLTSEPPAATPAPTPSAPGTIEVPVQTSEQPIESNKPENTPNVTTSPKPTASVKPSPTPTPTPSKRPGGSTSGGSSGGDDDRPDVKPTPTPHVHEFGEWVSKDDELEETTCSCGHKETRPHKYGEVTTTYETKDGKHIKIEESVCINCHHKKVVKSDPISCTYDVTIDDDYEHKTCNVCGDKIDVEHKYKLTDTSYEQKSGKHIEVNEYTCSACNHKKTEKSKEEECTYGSLEWDSSHEYKICSICDYELDLGAHALGSAKPNAVGEVTYQCTHNGCGYEEEHTHTKGETDTLYEDDKCHTVIVYCDECGQEISRDSIAHNYVVIVEGRDEIIKKCSGCGDEISEYIEELEPTPTPEPTPEAIAEIETPTTVSYHNGLVLTRKKRG